METSFFTHKGILSCLKLKSFAIRGRILEKKMMKKHEILKILKEKKLSNTGPRKKILEILMNGHMPLSVQEICEKLEEEGLCFNESTVYRNLQKFLEVDLVQTFTLNDGVARFEFIKGQKNHHHHIVCIKCKKMDCLDLCKVETLFDEVIKKHGFMPVSHNLEFYGLCKSCSTSPLK
jgi:Fe2+ or Zn2+ uptake regulation protein